MPLLDAYGNLVQPLDGRGGREDAVEVITFEDLPEISEGIVVCINGTPMTAKVRHDPTEGREDGLRT